MPFGPEITLILVIITILGSACVCYLIYLILKTKLTHIDQFRKNFARGFLLVLVVAVPIFVIINIFTLTAELFNLLTAVGFLFMCISISIVLYGLSKLNDYIKSIIVYEKERNIIPIASLASLPVPIALFIYSWSIGTITLEISIFALHVTSAAYTFALFYSAIYCYFTHQLLKDFKIRMILYSGIGIAFLIIPQILMHFNHLLGFRIHMMVFAACCLCAIVFLIIGYRNFRNRMKEIQESLTTH